MPAVKRTASAPASSNQRTARQRLWKGARRQPTKRQAAAMPTSVLRRFVYRKQPVRYAAKRRPTTNNPMTSSRFFDAMHRRDMPVPVPGTQGAFVTVPSVCRRDFSTSDATSVFVIIQWTQTLNRGMIFTNNRNVNHQTNSIISGALMTGHPSAVRPLAMSLRVRNTSVFTAMQGSVRVLCTPEALEYEFEPGDISKVTSNFLFEVSSMIDNHPKTKSYTANDFASTKCFVIPPASQVAYKDYQPYVPITQTFGENDQLKSNQAFIDSAERAPMNTTILEFNATVGGVNNYDLCVHSQDACRFPANTLYSHLSKEVASTMSDESFTSAVRRSQNIAGHAMQHFDPTSGFG